MTSTSICPKCGAPLTLAEILAAGSFVCPNCGAELQAPPRYAGWIGVCSLALSVVTALALGFRGFRLLYAGILLWVVIDFLALHLLKYAVPPKIEMAVPQIPLRQLIREIIGPSELKLRDKKRPQSGSRDTGENPDG